MHAVHPDTVTIKGDGDQSILDHRPDTRDTDLQTEITSLETGSGGNLSRGFESLPRRFTPPGNPMVERNTAARDRRPQRVAMTGQLAIRAPFGDRDHRPTIAQPIIRDDLQLPGDDRSIDHTRSTASSDTTPYAKGSSTSARHGRRRGGDLGFGRVSYAASCLPFAAATARERQKQNRCGLVAGATN